MASSTVYCRSSSTFAVAASYRLLTTVAMSVSSRPSRAWRAPSHHLDAHAPRGALHDAHGGIDGRRVEIDELLLGDLPHLLPAHLADLVPVGHRRGLGDARGALEQDRGR